MTEGHKILEDFLTQIFWVISVKWPPLLIDSIGRELHPVDGVVSHLLHLPGMAGELEIVYSALTLTLTPILIIDLYEDVHPDPNSNTHPRRMLTLSLTLILILYLCEDIKQCTNKQLIEEEGDKKAVYKKRNFTCLALGRILMKIRVRVRG